MKLVLMQSSSRCVQECTTREMCANHLIRGSNEEWQRHRTITAAWTQLFCDIGQTVTEASALVYDAFTEKLALPPLVVPRRPTVH